MNTTRRTELIGLPLITALGARSLPIDEAVDRAALRALPSRPGVQVRLRSEGATFAFRGGDARALVAADTVEGMFVRSDTVPPVDGAWVRIFDGPAEVGWFARGMGDDTAAIHALAALFRIGAITVPSGHLLLQIAKKRLKAVGKSLLSNAGNLSVRSPDCQPSQLSLIGSAP